MADEYLKLRVLADLELRRRKKSFTDWLKMVSPHNIWDVPHLEYIRHYIQRIVDGESLQVMILAPPRHGKSEQNTVHLAPYYLYKNPKKHVILGAYSQEFANGFSLRARKLYRECMPNESQKNAVMEWHTDKGGGLKAAGIRGGVTGRGGDLIILDDPIKNEEEAYSKKIRDKVWNEYRYSFFTRKEPGGSIILTMTPWHHDDLAGRILNSDDAKNWIVLKFPAIAEENDIINRKEGEALWPWRFPIDELLKIKSVIGDKFNAMYQQNPVIVEGNIIKREWFVIQDDKDWPVRYDFTGQYWDTAHKKGQQNDYSACATLAKYRGRRYLIDMFKARLEFPELKDEVINRARIYKPDFIGIEDKASGQDLIPELSRTDELPVNPEPLPNRGDKIVRVNAITPMLRNDPIYLPKGAHWIDDFLDEICLFPQAPHDDQVDAFTHGMEHQREVGYSLEAIIGR